MTHPPNNDPPEYTINDRSAAREIALQILYEIDSAGHDPDGVVATHLQVQQPNRRTARYVRELVGGVIENRAPLDAVIHRFAPEWPIEQIAIIDRNILRIAVFEFAVSQRAPVGVAIDEAVELAKRFGSDASSGFVNGVLGAVAEQGADIEPAPPTSGDDGIPT